MSEHVHYMKVEADSPDEDGWRGEPTVKFECRAEPAAKCRTYPNCDCDGWPCDHPEEPQDECWMQGWFDSDGHFFIGENSESSEENGLPRETNHEGFIDGFYDGDFLTWEWAA